MAFCLSASPRLDQLRSALEQVSRTGVGPRAAVFVRLIRECTSLQALAEGKWLHSLLVSRGLLQGDPKLGNYVVKMYLECGSIDEARRTFDGMDSRDVILWTEMIAAYARRGHYPEAIQVLRHMRLEGVRPDRISLVTSLNACCSGSMLSEGYLIHSHVVEQGLWNLIVETALVSMYAKCGRLERARDIFYRMSSRDVVSWNAMISANAESGHFGEGMKMLFEMNLEGTRPNKSTFVTTLECCVHLIEGKMVHSCVMETGLETDVEVATALVDMYGKQSLAAESLDVFLKVPQKDGVLWNALIAAQDSEQDSLLLYRNMLLDGRSPDRVTFLHVLSACAGLGFLSDVRAVHLTIVDSGVDHELTIQNALVAAYAKCGSLESAKQVFLDTCLKDVVSWNSMVAAFAQHGQPQDAFRCLAAMQAEGFKPDGITMASVLSACSCSGLLQEGRCHFDFVKTYILMVPRREHYGCMMDLLARLGRLDEAEKLLLTAVDPAVRDDAVLWTTLLSACRVYEDLERGRRASQRLQELEPSDAASYVALSNICAGQGLNTALNIS